MKNCRPTSTVASQTMEARTDICGEQLEWTSPPVTSVVGKRLPLLPFAWQNWRSPGNCHLPSRAFGETKGTCKFLERARRLGNVHHLANQCIRLVTYLRAPPRSLFSVNTPHHSELVRILGQNELECAQYALIKGLCQVVVVIRARKTCVE